MAWIEARKKKDGTFSYFVRDIREGRQISIAMPDGVNRAYAQSMKEQYEVRRQLEGLNHGMDR